VRKIGTGCLLTMTTCRCGSLRQSFRAVRRARATWVLAAMRIAGGKGKKMKGNKETAKEIFEDIIDMDYKNHKGKGIILTYANWLQLIEKYFDVKIKEVQK